MEFVTTDGKLEIIGDMIVQKRLTNIRRNNILVRFFFFFFFVNLLSKNIDKLNETEKFSAWIGIIFYGCFVLLYIVFVIISLFRQILSNKVDINNISEIKLTDCEEGLEKNVLVKVKSGRYKIYVFRNLEKEYKKLLDYLSSQNPSIVVTPLT